MRRIIIPASFAASLVAGAAAEAQVVFADVGKNLEYQQTGGSTVVPLNGGANAFFYARAFFGGAPAFDGGVLTFAGPASPQAFNVSGILDCCGHPGVGYQTGYMTRAAMDTDYPTGVTYTLTATNSSTLDSQSVDVPYAADIFSADIPALTPGSFAALQNADPHTMIEIDFHSFTPDAGATLGQGFFSIYDYTAGAFVAGAAGLPDTTTSLFLAPSVLTAGHSYVYELIFDDLVGGDANGVPIDFRADQRTLGYFTVPGAVPEPAVWALMLAGFGLVGAELRRGAATKGRAAA